MFKNARTPIAVLAAGVSLVGSVALAAPASAQPAVKTAHSAYTIRAAYPSGAYVITQVPVGTSTTTALVVDKQVRVPNRWRITVTDRVGTGAATRSKQIASTTVDFYTAQYLRQQFTNQTSVKSASSIKTTVGSAPQARSIYRGAMFTAKYAAETLYNRNARITLSQHDATRLLQQATTYLAKHGQDGTAALAATREQLRLSHLYTGSFTVSAQAGVGHNGKSIGGYRAVSVAVKSDVDATVWRATAYATGGKQLTLSQS